MKVRSLFSSVVIALAAMGVAHATTVTPGGFANTNGNGQSSEPFDIYGTGGSRFQQVYGSSLFTGFTNSELITSVAFRPKQNQFGTFIGNNVNLSNVIIQLSTTSKNDAMALSGNFAENIGANVITVFSGPLSLVAGPAGPGGVNPFDYLINFTTGFLYDKSMGNLLLDILIPDNATVSGNGSIGFRLFDTYTDVPFPSSDGMGSVYGATGSGPQGANSTLAVVSQFTSRTVAATVPESGSLLLMLVPVFGAMAFMRQRMVRVQA